MERLTLINDIIEEYEAEGYTLTLRQLYYQLVSRDVIVNKLEEYARLSRLLKEGRMGGIVDWSAIEDRLRRIHKLPSWRSPEEILNASASQFALNKQEGQPVYMEVWVEKDALSEVVRRAADAYQIPVMVNRGYGSVSMIYDAYQRISSAFEADAKGAVILYLGDHDPSGLDMIRDIQARIMEMLDGESGNFSYNENYVFHVQHIALQSEQVKQYAPPPNPAKFSDPRATWYIENFGPTSWEVDALEPRILNNLITAGIEEWLVLSKFNAIKAEETRIKKTMMQFIKTFENFNNGNV
jgi:hypothetical protein